MMKANRPVPVDANEKNVAPTTALVYPAIKAETPVADAAPAEPEYKIKPCTQCAWKAEQQRQMWRETHPETTHVDGAHQPYNVAKSQSAAAAKKNKAACAPVKRTKPDSESHTYPAMRGVHCPYVARGWNGICTGQDICKMLQVNDDPENPKPQNCICDLTENVPKCMVACLDWVNRGECKPRDGVTVCPYAHPDLTQVHPDVCCNFLLTGICRFCSSSTPSEDKKAQTVSAAAGDAQQGRSKGKRHGRSRGPSDCMGCHCVAEEMHTLLPGLTKKILRPLRHEGTGTNKMVVEWDRTDLDRALALYRAYLSMRL